MTFKLNGKMKVGIVGLGSIGSFLMSELKDERYIEVIAAADIDKEKRTEMGKLYPDVYLTDDFAKFPDAVDVYVECAGASVADPVAKYAIGKGKIAIIASVGGLSDIRPLRRLARDTGGHLYIPSGAIGGLDALKAIPSESIHEVRLTTRKNPNSFKGVKYIQEKGIDLDAIKKPTVIFEGNAGDAVKAFPKNINVSAILSYAGIGRENTKVVIIADPSSTMNRHEVVIKSEHGDVKVEISNVPFELNPRTSKLAAFSILAAVKSLVYTITIG
jgi:aspartate dehydrogenase